MKCGSKILGFLLVAAVMSAPLTTGVLAEADNAVTLPAGVGERPAACHMRGGQTLPDSPLHPRPTPANYTCCLTGHNAAVVQTSYSSQPSTESARVALPIELALTGLFLSRGVVSIVLSASPPGAAPLRI
jgi:hypothetical protein